MERHCLNCVWLNKEKMHCDYDFNSIHKPDFLDDDNNFIDDNEELIQDINIYDDFRCGDDRLETFEELFKYIDDVISEGD